MCAVELTIFTIKFYVFRWAGCSQPLMIIVAIEHQPLMCNMAAPPLDDFEHVERDNPNNGSPQGRNRTAAERGIDMHANLRTKEVLDNIAAASLTDPSLNILVVGKTGVGKTTFIDGLFENEQAQIITRQTPHTEQVTPHTLRIESPGGRPINVHVTDTPGTEALKGVGKRENHKRYLSEVSEAYRRADIVLYCLRMDDHVRGDDVEFMKFLLKKFGARLWAKVVFVFTFANRVSADHPEEHKLQMYNSRYSEMERNLRRAMEQAGISEPIAAATSICVAGHPVNKLLPDGRDWACSFLVNCLKSGITDNTKAALLCSTWKRWAITTRRTVTGVAGMTGVTTGLGLIVMGGLMSSTLVTLPLGVPMIAIGASITIYSVGASTKHAINTEKIHKDMEVQERIQNLRPREDNDLEN